MSSKLFHVVTASAVIALAAGSLRGAAPAGPVDFTAHDIDANFRGGYSVSVADFNKDGKIDVIANSLQAQELAWYENPSWARHVIVAETQQIVNQAMTDIDGDGIPEVAFQSSFAMQPANSAGLNWIARQRRRSAPAVEGAEDRSVPDLASRRVGRPRRRRQEGAAQRAAPRREERWRRPTTRTRPRCSGTARRTGSGTSSPPRFPASSIASGR